MEIIEISVNIGATKGLANYSSIRADAWAKATLTPDEDYEECYRQLWAIAEAQVEAQIDGA